MASVENSGYGVGAGSNPQQSLSELVYPSASASVEKEIDFYVGPKGHTLPAELKHWIGVNKRDSFMRKAKNPVLQNAVNQLYRPGSIIGDGGTASVVLFERRTGRNLGRNGGNHVKKAQEMIRYISNKVLSEKLSLGDRKLAKKLRNDLQKALGGRK